MTTSHDDPDRRILVGFDGSAPALAALRWAAVSAERTGDEVVVVQGYREPLFDGRSWAEQWDDPDAGTTRAEAELERIVASIGAEHPSVSFAGRLVASTGVDALLDAAPEARAVVVGHRGRGGFADLLLGSTARSVAARSPRPVVVVRGAWSDEGEVLVGIDGSEDSRTALAWAAAEARRRGTGLHVVMAWSYLLPAGVHGPVPFSVDYSEDDARRVLDAICDDVLGEDPGLAVRREATCELAAKALLARSEGAALLVVGPRRSSLTHRIDLGSVAAQLIHHARGPLAIVRTSVGGTRT